MFFLVIIWNIQKFPKTSKIFSRSPKRIWSRVATRSKISGITGILVCCCFIKITRTTNTIDAFDGKEQADLLAAEVRTPETNPYWEHWPKTNRPLKAPMSIFFSVTRYSNRALKLLDQKYRDGYVGFNELLSPSLLNENGLIVADFWGAERFRQKTVARRFYSPKTYRNLPTQKQVGSKRDYLYHPVKDDRSMRLWTRTIRWVKRTRALPRDQWYQAVRSKFFDVSRLLKFVVVRYFERRARPWVI